MPPAAAAAAATEAKPAPAAGEQQLRDKFAAIQQLFGAHWSELSAAEREAAATLYQTLGHAGFAEAAKPLGQRPRAALAAGKPPTAAEAAAFRAFAATLPNAMATGRLADGTAWPSRVAEHDGDLLDDVLDIVAEARRATPQPQQPCPTPC